MMEINREMLEGIIMDSDKLEKIVDTTDIKIKCYDFAIKVTQNGIYRPNEIQEIANKIFQWVISEKQN